MIKVKRLFKSLFYAFKGLAKVLREEQNLRLQTVAAAAVIILAWLFKISALEWAILTMAIALVILMEIINSAVERVSDVLKPRINSYVMEIKDIMAAAVLIASAAAALAGGFIFIPHLIKLIWQ
jgi:undecaprenol kinase